MNGSRRYAALAILLLILAGCGGVVVQPGLGPIRGGESTPPPAPTPTPSPDPRAG